MSAPPLLELLGLATPSGTPANLVLAPGEAVALLGANGAGKSTLLRGIIGLAPVPGIAIRLAGRDIAPLPAQARARLGIGYVPQGRRLFPAMSVRDTLDVACRAGAGERARRRAEVDALFPDLAEHAGRRAWQLSGGQQQMLAIGRALMARPRLLLLDEPSLGLAPRAAGELFVRLAAIAAAGTALLLAEQNLARALALCARGYVLANGRVALAGPAPALAADPALRRAFLGQ